MNDPATIIATRWYHGRDLDYEGVNLGECMTYDVLQVTNRIIISTPPPANDTTLPPTETSPNS